MANVIEEGKFGGTPNQLAAVVSTLAEIRTDIVFKVSPKSDGRVRIDFTRQVDLTEPRGRIIAKGTLAPKLPNASTNTPLLHKLH